MTDKLGIVLLAMGGPETTRDIPEYLYNIFSDRSIIRLPGGPLVQKPLARLISRMRSRKVAEHYDLIGGSSPLYRWTRAQADLIEQRFDAGRTVRCYAGMRYFRPTIPAVIDAALGDGCTELCFLPMYPQYSSATTGSSFTVAKKSLQRHSTVAAHYVNDFHDTDGYISFLASYIERHIRADELLLFSAHSLPQKFVDEGDPYVDQVKRTAQLAAGNREYVVTFQSRTGPVDWVGPDTIDEAKRLLDDPARRLFIVPIAFVCDHIETLYELDIELPQLLGDDKGGRIRRMPMFNDDPQFAEVLIDVVRRKLEATHEV